MTTASFLFQSVRPQQWIKNSFILAPLVFSRKAFDYPSLLVSLQTVIIFCALTGAAYLINDLVDLKADRKHPTKRHRPLASGNISAQLAIVTAAILLAIALAWGIWVKKGLFLILVIYLIIQLLYNLRLKEIVVLDIFCVSSGFFLRVIAGAVAIEVTMSHWLTICTILISIFLTICKRRHELVILGLEKAANHRKVQSKYSTYLLDQMIAVITGATLLSYLLYCTSSETIEKFQTNWLICTSPFVLYGIFRYLYLLYQETQESEPEKIIVSDWPLLLNVLLWGLACIVIIYVGI